MTLDVRQGGEALTSLLEAAVETVKDRSGDLVEVVQHGVGTLGAGAAERWAPDTQRRSKSWLWVLLLGAGVVVVLAVLRQRAAANEAADRTND